jgi:HAD superfamily hydrolase (TIGR01484 family)
MDPAYRHTTSLLASDLDGTLVPVGADPTYPGAVEELRRRLAGREDLCLAYVTGRTLAGSLAAMEASGLPRPAAVACDVGTQLYWFRDRDWHRDETFHAGVLAAMGGVDTGEVLEAIRGGTRFEPQADERQSDVKASFRLPAPEDADPQLAAALSVLASRRWLLSPVASRCVFSGDMLLDVLPGGIDKAAAVHFIRKTLRLKHDQVVYAGDSGNDLTALTAGFRSIIVGNATPGLAERIREFATQEGRPGTVHAATGQHLHGVLEGARRFGIL